MKNIKKLDWKFFGVMFVIMCVIYIITRYCLGNMYTPKWTAMHIFSYAMSGITVISLLGYRRMAALSIIGYVAGITTGELFGGFESHIGPQYLHWGWLISIVVLIVFVVIGYFVQKVGERNESNK